jgi:hypothetical protein
MGGTAVKLAPSILSADFARLGEQVVAAERLRAAVNHIEDETEAAERSALQRSQ